MDLNYCLVFQIFLDHFILIYSEDHLDLMIYLEDINFLGLLTLDLIYYMDRYHLEDLLNLSSTDQNQFWGQFLNSLTCLNLYTCHK